MKKFILIGLCITFANAITHHNSGYNYPPNGGNPGANTGFIPNSGPCCQELASLKLQLAQAQQQIQQLQQYQGGGRIHSHKHHESSSGSLNSIHDSSLGPVRSKGYTHHTPQPVIGNVEFAGTKVFNYHSQGPLANSHSPGQIHYVNQHQHHHHSSGGGGGGGGSAPGNGLLSNAAITAAAAAAAATTTSNNHQSHNIASTAGGQVVQGHLLVGNQPGPVNGPSAAQLIANKYSSHANSGYNLAATTVLKPPIPQGGFTVSQTSTGYNTNSNQNYNGAASHQYAQTTKLTSQNSGGFGSGSSNSGYITSSGLGTSSGPYSGNYASSASDKTYTQTHFGSSSSLAGTAIDGGANVEKHIYVHVPPEDFSDTAEERARLQQLIPPKKHYKIIFIKAPTVESAPNYQQLLAQNGGTQEKTLVYVLVKKPDEPSAEELATLQNHSVKLNKPEVFFIKYKTRKEAEQAIQSIGQGQQPFGGSFVGSDLGVDIRNAAGSSHHEGISSVASAIETAETYSSSSSSSGSGGDVSSSYLPPPSSSGPKPAPVYGVPSVK